MVNRRFIAGLAAGLCASFGAQLSAAPKLIVSADREGALYTCQDKAVFKISVTDGKNLLSKGKVKIKLSADMMTVLSDSEHDLEKGNPFSIEGSMGKPGFLWCQASLEGTSVNDMASAGFDVQLIRQARPEPADFDKFWADLMRRQSEIKDAVSCEPLPDSIGKPGYDYFKITVKTLDNAKIYGYLGVPKNSAGPFSALVAICGAGPGYNTPDPTFIREDMMTLAINVHPFDPTLPKEEIDKLYNKEYWTEGALNRDTYYFRNAIVGINAAADWLSQHPKFDRKNLMYLSASQGGAFGIILAGLNHKFSAVASSVPAMCDFGSIQLQRKAAWPFLANKYKDDPEKLKQALETGDYYDVANFAKRVNCPVLMTVGFLDNCCFPSSVYSAYNELKAPKMILNGVKDSHAVPWEHLDGIWQWIQNYIGNDELRKHVRYFSYKN